MEISFKGFCYHQKKNNDEKMLTKVSRKKIIFITQGVCLYNVRAAETDKYYRKLKRGFVILPAA